MIYDFAPGRGGQHVRDFLDEWKGKLICDDYSGYKQSFANGVTEIGCMAHARRKFFDLYVAGKSQIAEQAIELIGQLYQVEREAQCSALKNASGYSRIDHAVADPEPRTVQGFLEAPNLERMEP